jgi:hypothetical protein
MCHSPVGCLLSCELLPVPAPWRGSWRDSVREDPLGTGSCEVGSRVCGGWKGLEGADMPAPRDSGSGKMWQPTNG